jgi:hypothetical protein
VKLFSLYSHFPDPAIVVANGRTALYLESDICDFEQIMCSRLVWFALVNGTGPDPCFPGQGG